MVLDAVESAVSDDDYITQRVVDGEQELDELEERAMQSIFEVVVLQAPVSEDARFLMSTLSIVGELEQAGDDAVKLARRAQKLRGDFPPELQAPLGVLAEEVVQLLVDTGRLYDQYSEEEAVRIIAMDAEIDSAYKNARNHVLETSDASNAMSRQLFRTIEIFHALEHVADHAVEIAKRLQKFNRDFSSRPSA